MKLSDEWEAVLKRVPDDVKAGRRYYAPSGPNQKVTIVIDPIQISVRSRPQKELRRAEIKVRDEVRRRVSAMTGDSDPIKRTAPAQGKSPEDDWSYEVVTMLAKMM